MLLSEIRVLLRPIIGDDDTADLQYTDDDIDMAIRSTIAIGKVDASLAVTGTGAAAELLPEPTRLQLARLLLESARVRLGGQIFDYTLRTRGVYYSSAGKSGLSLLAKLKQDLYELENQDDPDATSASEQVSTQDFWSFQVMTGGRC